MESKKIKKSPKSTKKKTSSPPSAISPLKDNDESSPSPENINNDKLNNNKINSPIKEKKEGNTEKKEEKENKEEKEGKNELKKQIEENMALDFDEPENFNPLFFRELNYFPPIIRDKESPNDRISSALKKMEKGDDMDILNELINLREFLSMSSERIGYNPSIGKLLEEICKNLTKTYLPEMIIYSLQCINYIIDINPSLVSILKKINAISPIMNTITSVEDITCVDHIIKIFEKISMQNSRILLENKVMETFLVNIFDFLNIYQKKSVMKICYYITNKRISLEEYNLYIKPTMNILVNLIFFDDNDERENLFIVEKATNIFYNILNQIKNEFIFKSNDIKEKEEKNEKEVNNSNNNNDDIVDEIIKSYNIIENFKLILDKFFLKNSKIISEQLIQYILRTIVLILELSQEGINKIFSNKFLELISEIINIEFISEPQNNSNNNNNFNNDNINNNVINILPRRTINNLPQNKRFSIFSLEFFDIMNSLFPSSKDILYKKNVEDKKILKPENKTYYDIFCQKIFLPLINNVIKKSINITLSNNFIRLISSFINNATKDDIILLPKWMQFKEFHTDLGKVKKSKEATRVISNKYNIVKTFPKANSIIAATNIGRGDSAPIIYYDEVEHTLFFPEIFRNTAFAYREASAGAEAVGKPHCRILTGTPGNMNTSIAREVMPLLDSMIPWTEQLYDMTSKQIIEYKSSYMENFDEANEGGEDGKSAINVLRMEYDYKQLRKTDEWVEEQRKMVGDKATVKREVLLIRGASTDNSPISPEDIEYLTAHKVRSDKELIIQDKWLFKIYYHDQTALDQSLYFNPNIPYLVGIDPSTGAGKDNFAITIINPWNMKIAAEFKNKYLSGPAACDLLNELVAHFIPKAVLIPEKNSIGAFLIQMLLKTPARDNVYWSEKSTNKQLDAIAEENYRDRELRLASQLYSKYGVVTSNSSRNAMFSLLFQYIDECKYLLNTEYLVDDICKLVRTATGKVEAEKGSHDDNLMSYLLAIYIYHTGDNLEYFGVDKRADPLANENHPIESLPINFNAINRASRSNFIAEIQPVKSFDQEVIEDQITIVIIPAHKAINDLFVSILQFTILKIVCATVVVNKEIINLS
mgnify:CR=1 FL=1